jgi:hypothetical protein
MKNAILAIALFSILTGIIYFFAINFVNKVSNNDSRLSLKINNKNYYLDIARTDEEKNKGLAKFDSIKDNEGMIFIFEVPGRYSFYMKDMKFNIDIIFLDENHKIISLFKNVKFTDYKNPRDYEIYQPDYNSKYVIELKAGEIENIGIKTGDTIEFNLK